MEDTGFEIVFSIREAESDKGVVFKSDGKRFATSSRTLKISLDTMYKLTFVCTPYKKLDSLNILGKGLVLTEEGKEERFSTYTTKWDTTGILTKATARAEREEVPLALNGEFGSLKKIMQVKFYKNGDKHVETGTEFESLLWKCDLNPEDKTEVVVVDELYQ
uniref:CB1 cannabinoid receptor-interacting protein 1 n=1 Tax=Syphacia muris TaxID=451379 RepID=A0A0N5A9U6_9BILA